MLFPSTSAAATTVSHQRRRHGPVESTI